MLPNNFIVSEYNISNLYPVHHLFDHPFFNLFFHLFLDLFFLSVSSVLDFIEISFNSIKLSTIFFWFSETLPLSIVFTSSTILLYLSLVSLPSIVPLSRPVSKLSTSSTVNSFLSALVFNLFFLASVTILSISLNLSLLTFTHFGSFNLSDCCGWSGWWSKSFGFWLSNFSLDFLSLLSKTWSYSFF